MPLPGVPAHPKALGVLTSPRVPTVWWGLVGVGMSHLAAFASGRENCVPSAFGRPAWPHGASTGHGGMPVLEKWGGVSQVPSPGVPGVRVRSSHLLWEADDDGEADECDEDEDGEDGEDDEAGADEGW